MSVYLKAKKDITRRYDNEILIRKGESVLLIDECVMAVVRYQHVKDGYVSVRNEAVVLNDFELVDVERDQLREEIALLKKELAKFKEKEEDQDGGQED